MQLKPNLRQYNSISSWSISGSEKDNTVEQLNSLLNHEETQHEAFNLLNAMLKFREVHSGKKHGALYEVYELGEEDVLQQMADCCERLKATALSSHEQDLPSLDELFKLMKNRLMNKAIPRHFSDLLAGIPHNLQGKIDGSLSGFLKKNGIEFLDHGLSAPPQDSLKSKIASQRLRSNTSLLSSSRFSSCSSLTSVVPNENSAPENNAAKTSVAEHRQQLVTHLKSARPSKAELERQLKALLNDDAIMTSEKVFVLQSLNEDRDGIIGLFKSQATLAITLIQTILTSTQLSQADKFAILSKNSDGSAVDFRLLSGRNKEDYRRLIIDNNGQLHHTQRNKLLDLISGAK